MLPKEFFKNNRFDQYRTFCTVMQLRSISLAAQHLGLSQSAVTLRIKSLEDDLQCKFFVRSKRLIPTDVAVELYQTLLPLVNGLDSAVERFIEKKTNKKKTIRIAANSVACTYLIPKALNQFYKIYDDIEMKLYNIDSDSACEHLKNESVDFILYSSNSCKDGDCDYKSCHIFDPILLLKSGHPLENMADDDLTLKEISKYPIINIKNNPSDVKKLPEIIDNISWVYNIAIENGGIDLSKRFVDCGAGVAIVPEICIEEQDFGFVYKNLKKILPPIEYGIFTKKGIKHNHYVNNMINLIKENSLS